jgi:hypothetical protein
MSGEGETAPTAAAGERSKEAAGLNNVTNVVIEREMDQARIESVSVRRKLRGLLATGAVTWLVPLLPRRPCENCEKRTKRTRLRD